MLYSLDEDGKSFVVNHKFVETAASDLGLLEKAIEEWIAQNPALLFPKEQVLVFAQSVAGASMADILGLDSLGKLIIVEIKRDWSDRSTVSQLLEYAARYQDSSYETFNQLAKEYKNWAGRELIERFREFADLPQFSERDLFRSQRVFIVAPESDIALKKIVQWLRRYGVPIEFVPFRLFADDQQRPRFLDIEGATGETEAQGGDDVWAGHWIFNTNETYCPGAYERMFAERVIAIQGYENGGENLEGAAAGQKVFAYVNRQGIRALGDIIDEKVKPGKGIFLDNKGVQLPEEYHLDVAWKVVLPQDLALSNSQAADMGYSLPVRTVFGQLHRGKLAARIESEVRKRGAPSSSA